MSRLVLVGFSLVIAAATACATDKEGSNDPMGGADGGMLGDSGNGGDGGNGGHGSDAGPGTDGGSMTTASPQPGRWFYVDRTPILNTCPSLVDPGQGAGGFSIDSVTPTSFRVIPEDSTAPFTCTRIGTSYMCPERAAYVRDYRPAVDAVVTFHATAQGTFSSSTRATGRQDANVSCIGTQCALLSTALPCQFAVAFTIDHL